MLKRFNQHYFNLLLEMTIRELKVRYKNTYLGFFWTIFNPLFQMMIMGTVFSLFINIPNYFLFLFSGLLPWQFFNNSLSVTTSCFSNERGLLHKAKLPQEIIPFSIINANFFLFIISFSLFMIYYIFASKSPDYAKMLLLIPAVTWILLFTTGASLLTSTLAVKYRDVKYATTTLLSLWFYATPIIYSASLIPQKLQLIHLINPLATPFALIRTSLLNHPLPNPFIITSNLLISFAICIVATILFKTQYNYFVDHV